MKKKLSTTQLILLSFIAVILPGAFILSLPVSSASGKATPFIDALFTATTSTCVTGLVTVTTASHWSTFGHAVILILIQAGGLGVITVTSLFMVFLYKKMGLSERLLIQDAFNLNTLSGIMQFVKKVIYGTFIVEGIGALLYMTVFIPEFGLKGIWLSVFNSVSAFCNAGIDIIGENSLADFITNPLVNFVTVSLIILGGIGYIVSASIPDALSCAYRAITRPMDRIVSFVLYICYPSHQLIQQHTASLILSLCSNQFGKRLPR